MRYRGSITGPVILILLGFLFLAHTFSPGFDLIGLISRYWPFLLIGWGVVGLLEVFLRSSKGSVPVNGVSGGGWFIVLLVIFFGYASWQWSNPGTWWHRAGFDQSVAFIGDSHDFSFEQIRKQTGPAPRIVIESFRGDAKVTGTDSDEVTVSGHKSVRALDMTAAQKANRASGVEAVVEGNTIIIRCNQDRSAPHTEVSTDLEIAVPKGAVLEAIGRNGDFDISSIHSVDLSSDNAGVKVREIAGEVKIDTRASDQVECTNVKGSVSLRGRGEDVSLSSVAGQVSVVGDYTGTITLRAISNPVRIESMHTQFDAQGVPGNLTLERGSLEANNLVGPLKVNAKATDVTLNQFRSALDLTVEKGDVQLKPGILPLSTITVNAQSGNVSLTLPAQASFDLSASTAHGSVSNDFGAVLTTAPGNNGATLSGKIGSGPQIAITGDHGDITISKSGSDGNKAEEGETTKSDAHPQAGSDI